MVKLTLLVAIAIGVSGCATHQRQGHGPRYYGIPPDARDDDWLCLPARPVPVCRHVGEIRMYLHAQRAFLRTDS